MWRYNYLLIAPKWVSGDGLEDLLLCFFFYIPKGTSSTVLFSFILRTVLKRTWWSQGRPKTSSGSVDPAFGEAVHRLVIFRLARNVQDGLPQILPFWVPCSYFHFILTFRSMLTHSWHLVPCVYRDWSQSVVPAK